MATENINLTKRQRHLRVPVLADEEALIKRRAAEAGVPVAAYLRLLGLAHQVPSRIDNQCIEQLALINGDLGRLGGLLKLWLTNDVSAAGITPRTLRAVLSRIMATQDEMHALMHGIVAPVQRKTLAAKDFGGAS